MPDRFAKCLGFCCGWVVLGRSLRTFRYNRLLQTGSKLISHHSIVSDIIYNPFAGGLKGRNARVWTTPFRSLRDAGAQVELFATPGPNMAGELAAPRHRSRLRSDSGRGRRRHHQRSRERHRRVARSVRQRCPPARPMCWRTKSASATGPIMRPRSFSKPYPPGSRWARWTAGQAPPLFRSDGRRGARRAHRLRTRSGLKGRLGKLAYWHGGFRQFGRPVPRFPSR